MSSASELNILRENIRMVVSAQDSLQELVAWCKVFSNYKS